MLRVLAISLLGHKKESNFSYSLKRANKKAIIWLIMTFVKINSWFREYFDVEKIHAGH